MLLVDVKAFSLGHISLESQNDLEECQVRDFVMTLSALNVNTVPLPGILKDKSCHPRGYRKIKVRRNYQNGFFTSK